MTASAPAPAPLSEGLDLPLHEQQPQCQSTNIYYLKLKYKVTMKELINLFYSIRLSKEYKYSVV